jgi:hypothetical protein
MTYYGRWTYKYEIASKLGAAGVLIVHETEPASYDWNVVVHSWAGEAFSLADTSGNASRVAVQGWITLEKAKELFAQAGQDFDALKAQARTREFKPVALNATVSVNIENKLREVRSCATTTVDPLHGALGSFWSPQQPGRHSNPARCRRQRVRRRGRHRDRTLLCAHTAAPEALNPVHGGDGRRARPARFDVLR